jgi:hypothetical protein
LIRLFFILLLSINLFAFDKVTAAKILQTVFLGVKSKQNLYICTQDKQYIDVIQNANRLILTDDLNRCDIIIFNKPSDLNNIDTKNKLLFATSYRGFKNEKKTFGAFYWFKGRPQIIFLKNRLQNQNLKLADYLQKYITDEL